MKKLLFADFETHGIEARPDYPPKPVGLALLATGWRRAKYHAWGHPEKNNSTAEAARAELVGLMRDGYTTVWHNAGFDLDVAETHLGVRWPAEHHDTLLLAFLVDPRFKSFGLKQLAENVLGEPPTERDELFEWLRANVPEVRRSPKKAGAYIACAPGDLAGRYAVGDVMRTRALFARFWADVGADSRLRSAYDRERRLTRHLITMERRGVPIRTPTIQADLVRFSTLKDRLEASLFRRLKVPKADRADFTWSGERFADALERAEAIHEWILTDKGNRATNAEDLREVAKDQRLVDDLEVRSQIATCLTTFMRPWHASGREHGRFFARFNQVRQDYHGGGRQIGAVTGRLSMSPNLQNVIRGDKDERVPRLRDYIGPGGRGVWLFQRDYSQQELRITAHYEEGPFLAMYLNNPKIDAHDAVGMLIRDVISITLDRRDVKDLNFGLLYGMGAPKLALKTGKTVAEARTLMSAHLRALPGVKKLKRRLEALARANEPLYTWGGRRYYCEEPTVIKGRLRTFEYKMLNVLIQGSAADCTKQAMVNYFDAGYDDRWPLLMQVHDELIGVAPSAEVSMAHAALREAMLAVDFKVPMLSDGKSGYVSWHRMKKVKEA